MKKYKDKEWLEDQINNQKKSIRQVGRELGVHQQTICNWAKRFNIEKEQKYKNKEWLRKQIREKDRLMADIADECGVTLSTIWRWADQFEIERIHSESV